MFGKTEEKYMFIKTSARADAFACNAFRAKKLPEKAFKLRTISALRSVAGSPAKTPNPAFVGSTKHWAKSPPATFLKSLVLSLPVGTVRVGYGTRRFGGTIL